MTTKLLWEINEVKAVSLALAEIVRGNECFRDSIVSLNKALKWLETKEELDLLVTILLDEEFVACLKEEEEL